MWADWEADWRIGTGIFGRGMGHFRALTAVRVPPIGPCPTDVGQGPFQGLTSRKTATAGFFQSRLTAQHPEDPGHRCGQQQGIDEVEEASNAAQRAARILGSQTPLHERLR